MRYTKVIIPENKYTEFNAKIPSTNIEIDGKLTDDGEFKELRISRTGVSVGFHFLYEIEGLCKELLDLISEIKSKP